MKRYLAGLTLIVVFVALLGIALTSKGRLTFLFAHASYYVIFLLVLSWVVSAVKLVKSLDLSLTDVISRNAMGVAAALVLTLIVFATVNTDFRTLSDETNLLSVSKNMFAQKDIRNITAGKYYYDNFKPITYELPKRPFVFPFLTSLLHSLTGFRMSNGFLLNYIAFFLFLAGLFIVVNHFTDKLTALAALILVLAHPVVSLFVACGGFDFFNGFFFFIALTTLFFYMRQPSKEKFAFMWMTFLMLSNIRYESIIYFAIALAGLCVFRFFRWETVKTHFTLFCLTPLLMLAFIFQRILSVGKYENPAGVALFGPAHFLNNIKDFFRSQFDFSFYLPYANILNLISAGCLIYIIFNLLKNRKEIKLSSPTFQFFVIFILAVLTNLFVIFCFYYGKISHPVSSRYFIITFAVLALVPVVARKLNPSLFNSRILFALALVMFLLYHPVAMEDRFTNTLTLNREFRQARAFIDALHNKNILIIYHRPGQFTAMDFGAVKFSYANSKSRELLNSLRHGLYSDIVVMQRIQYSNEKPIDGCTLNNSFSLQTLDKIQVSNSFYLKISKVNKSS